MYMAGSKTLLVNGSVGAAAFPSRLSTSGTNLVDENGWQKPFMKGFNIQPTNPAWSQATFNSIASIGSEIVTTVVFWDKLQPTAPSSGTDFSTIDTATYIPNLDTHIQRLTAAGLYTTLKFYYGPNATHCPTWIVPGSSTLATYTANAQSATQYLAQRYGDVADPLGAGQYTKAVVGFGINEPTPDSEVSGKNATMESEQVTMINWFRAYAPDWIGFVAVGFACATPTYNLTGTGQSTQNAWTNSDLHAYDSTGGNVVYVLHDYLMCTTSASDPWDGRQANGEDFKVNQGGTQIKTSNAADGAGSSDYHAYPPTVSGGVVSRALARDQQRAYIYPYKELANRANVPFMIGEWGWQGGVSTTGAANLLSDKIAAWRDADPVAVIQWDYATNQAQDSWAANPGASAGGTDSNGWLTATNTFFAN